VALIGAGAFVRAFALYPGTALAGIGIAVAGALLPSLVRLSVPDRVGPVTGLYTGSLIGGALLAAGLTEPLRSLFGLTPQAVLAVWSVPAAVALVAWLAWGRSPGADPSVLLPSPLRLFFGCRGAARRPARRPLHGKPVADLLRGAGLARLPVHRPRLLVGGPARCWPVQRDRW
jgi:hypothetical protein